MSIATRLDVPDKVPKENSPLMIKKNFIKADSEGNISEGMVYTYVDNTSMDKPEDALAPLLPGARHDQGVVTGTAVGDMLRLVGDHPQDSPGSLQEGSVLAQ